MLILYKILQALGTIGLYIICVSLYFFKPLFQSKRHKKQNYQDKKVDKQSMEKTKKEYNSLLEETQLLKQQKKDYQQKVKTLREEISWSRDRLLLEKWGKDGISLDEYRKKLEEEWNRALEDDDDSDSSN